MKRLLPGLSVFWAALLHAAPVPLFDGQTFAGWQGDTEKTWRIENGCLVAGDVSQTAPRNEFLATTRTYRNFDLRLKFKLLGSEGFVNSGVQFRSVRVATPPNEMSGFQADLGDPGYWGSLYDESRRKKTLAPVKMDEVAKVLRRGEWNDFRVRAEGNHIRIWLNDLLTVDYLESDPSIALEGLIALQIHGSGKTRVEFKELLLEELPAEAEAIK